MNLLAQKYRREVIFLDSTPLIQKMKQLKLSMYRDSYAANMRLFLSEVLDDSVDRIIYLDADTIIDGELRELFEIEMGDYPIAMCLDSVGISHKKDIDIAQDEFPRTRESTPRCKQ